MFGIVRKIRTRCFLGLLCTRERLIHRRARMQSYSLLAAVAAAAAVATAAAAAVERLDNYNSSSSLSTMLSWATDGGLILPNKTTGGTSQSQHSLC
jgi:uncharacterized protein (UPF0371 family)